MRVLVIGLLCAVCVYHNPQPVGAAGTAQPQAAMLIIASDDTRQLIIDVGDARADRETLNLPAVVRARPLSESPLPALVQQFMVPTVTQKYLLLKGEPTATPAPTATPYLPRQTASFRIQAPNTLDTPAGQAGARFVELTCPQCPPAWESSILAQLPAYAPIIVYAPGAVTLPGAWLIHIQPVDTPALPPLGRVVHLFERLPDEALAQATWRAGDVAPATYPARRMLQVDGRMTLLRIVFCLVAVLFSSIASFYLSMAVLRRMHAAVGYKPEK